MATEILRDILVWVLAMGGMVAACAALWFGIIGKEKNNDKR